MDKIKQIIYFLVSPVYEPLKRTIARRKALGLIKEDKSHKLEIGAGSKKGQNDWITLDVHRTCDIQWDLRFGIPFPNNSLDIIYSSHLFEHLTFNEIKDLLTECKRALKPNGIFSICVPNTRLYIEAYFNNNDNFINSQPSYYKPAYNATTKIDLLNYIAYMGGHHKYMFDEENIVFLLDAAGFKNARIRDFDSETDLKERVHESLYAEASK